MPLGITRGHLKSDTGIDSLWLPRNTVAPVSEVIRKSGESRHKNRSIQWMSLRLNHPIFLNSGVILVDIYSIKLIILFIPIIFFSLTIHEYAHGLVALKCGDSTASDMGRLTMNPLSHLDPLGTFMLIFTFLIFKAPFGWAKPVPVNIQNLNNPKRDIMLVSLAGPLANIVVAILSIITFKALLTLPAFSFQQDIITILISLTTVNLVLALFNLLPLPPLDGSKILIGILPNRLIPAYLTITRKAGFVLIALILIENFLHIKTISFILDPILQGFRLLTLRLLN